MEVVRVKACVFTSGGTAEPPVFSNVALSLKIQHESTVIAQAQQVFVILEMLLSKPRYCTLSHTAAQQRPSRP